MTRMLPYRLTICGIEELDSFARVGVSHVLSILGPQQPVPPVFERFRPHRRTTLRFDDVVVPVEGHAQPARPHVEAILALGRDLAAGEPQHLLVHCMAGVSRSTAAAAILMAQANPGREAAVFGEFAELRPRAWPNSRMIGFADELLGCGGAMSAALQRYYVDAVGQYRGLADSIRAIKHRAHEVPDG